jgi:hypothetical protein
MLAAALPIAPFDDLTKAFVKAALKKAAQFSSFRNAAAHGAEQVRDEETDLPIYVLADPQIPDPLPEGAGFTVEQINTSAENFDLLRRYLIGAHPDFASHRAPLENYIALVLALPNQADSKEASRNGG